MASETWRVVLASSEVREVEVESNGVQWCAFEDGYHGWGREQPSAVAAVVGLHGWPVAEILAPGEPTRAELRAQAFREGAEAMRESILDHLPCVTAERDECAARIHRVGVPPCPEVSR